MSDDMNPVTVRVGKKRTSKTWLVLMEGGPEPYEAKVVGVGSAEEAMVKVLTMNLVGTPVSARAARVFK